MTHLSPAELIDLAEQPDPLPAPHLSQCAVCREQITLLRAALSDAKEDEVPEPSAFFWDQFSGRVRRAIAADGRTRSPVSRWPWRPAFAAAVVLLVSTVVLVQFVRGPSSIAVPQEAGNRFVELSGERSLDLDLEPLDDDASWLLMADLTAQMDEEAPGQDLLIQSDAAEHALSYLSDSERRSLGQFLEAELIRSHQGPELKGGPRI